MKREFDYENISIKDIENNPHLIFECSGDEKRVLIDNEEIWKPIKQYENYYEISNIGNVKNIKTNKILKPYIHRCGYLRVRLYNDKKGNELYVHRLVAQAFIPNPDNLSQVNHINGNKKDNTVKNLEWCNNSQNQLHAYKNNLRKKYYGKENKNSVPVLQYDMNGNFIKEWCCIREAGEKTNTDKTGISNCCRNVCKSANNYIWKYKEEII